MISRQPETGRKAPKMESLPDDRNEHRPDNDEPGEKVGEKERPAEAVRVLVVDAQPLVADSLALALAAYHFDLEVLEDRPSSAAVILQTISEKRPDVTLLDYWMEMDAPALTRMILARRPDHKILVLSWFHGPREIEHALDAGAVGFLPKNLKVDQVAEGIRRAQAGERPVFAEQLEHIVRKIQKRDAEADRTWQKLVDLTPREILVLKMLSLGKGVSDIAEELFVSQSTVRKHIFNTLQKLDAHSQLEAIALARRYGLLQS